VFINEIKHFRNLSTKYQITNKFQISIIKPARRTKSTLGSRVTETTLNIEILIIEIYLYFGACYL